MALAAPAYSESLGSSASPSPSILPASLAAGLHSQPASS
jgi:hypothetical protein